MRVFKRGMVFVVLSLGLAISGADWADCGGLQEKSQPTPLGGYHGGVNSIAFAPDGRTLASAGWDRIVRLWDVVTAKELLRFEGHDNYIRSIAFSPSGKTLASAAQGETIRQWDVATGQEDRQFRTKFGNRNDGFCIAFSPDGQTIAVANANASIGLRDAVNGKELRSLAGHARGPVYAIAFSPDGKTLVSGAIDKTMRFWDRATGKELRQIKGHQGWVKAVAFSPDGKSLASGSAGPGGEKDVRLWDVLTGKELRRFEGQQGSVSSVGFSSDGKTLASNAGGDVLLWEVETGLPRAHFQTKDYSADCVAFSPDGKIIASGSQSNTLMLWDVTGLGPQTVPGQKRLSRQDLAARWADLASVDGTEAFRAIWLLAAAPDQAVPFLKDRLRPTSGAERASKLVADLDSAKFADREKASKSLNELGEAAEGAVRKTLNSNPSLEVRQRLEKYLKKREPELIRKLRAIESLEQIGSPEARQVLQTLTQEAPNPRVVQAASAALHRLGNRVSWMP